MHHYFITIRSLKNYMNLSIIDLMVDSCTRSFGYNIYITDYYAFCKFLLYYKFIQYFGIYHKELYSVDILCENSTSTMPVSHGEG